jgi:adenylate cyclase
MNILGALQVALTKGEAAQLPSKGTKNLDAYLKVLQANRFMQAFSRESLALARQYAEEAIALDPGYFAGYAALSGVILNATTLRIGTLPRAEALQQALELSQKALDLNPSSYTHGQLTFVYIFQLNPEKALLEAEQAVALGPNSAFAYYAMGSALFSSEKFDDAIPMFQKSLRLSPIPIGSVLLFRLADSYRAVGRSEEAIGTLTRLLELWPDNYHGHVRLAATYANSGRDSEARAEAKHVLQIDPNFSAERYIKESFVTKNQLLIDQTLSGLHKAGLQ